MTISTLPAQFEHIPVDIVNVGNERWVVGAQIGHAMGYATGGHAIGKIYKRHAHEFQTDDTMVVEIPTAAGKRMTRLYSAKGIAKIAMLADTPKAAAFRDWAAGVLTTPTAPEPETLLLAPPADLRDELIATQRELINAQLILLGRRNKEKKQFVPWSAEEDAILVRLAQSQGLKRDWTSIAQSIGRSRQAVSSRGHILRVKGLIE
jgi:hypothetical protein